MGRSTLERSNYLTEPSLQEALLSPSAAAACDQEEEQEPHLSLPPNTPSSVLAGDLDDSPSRSFMETSFYANLTERNLYTMREGLNEVDDAAGDDTDDDDDNDLPRSVRLWNRAMARSYRWILLLTIFGVWPLGIWSFGVFHHQTDSTFRPLSGTSSAVAQDAFQAAYGANGDWQNPMNPPLIVVLNARNETFSLTAANSEAFAEAQRFALNISSELPCWSEVETTSSHGMVSTNHNNFSNCSLEWLQVTSFYSLQQDGLDWIANGMKAADGFSIIIQIQYLFPSNFTGNEKTRISGLMNAVETYSAAHRSPYFSVHFTGIHWFQKELTLSTRSDIMRMDLLVLPIALVLIGVVLPRANPRAVWIIPLVTIITTVAVWSGVMRLVVAHMQITQFTPTVMMSLSLGMGIDYTLFLLARYLESHAMPSKKKRFIGHMIWKGGNVVVLSGLTLMFSFLGLCFLPLQMLKSVGVGAAVAIASALLVNLTIVPALLYTRVGGWIVQADREEVVGQHASGGDGRVDEVTRALLVESSNNSAGDLDAIHQAENAVPSFWHQLSKHLLHPYKGTIALLVVIQLLFLVGIRSVEIKSSLSFDLLLPADSPSLKTYHDLSAKVGQGRLHPYRILFDGGDANLTMTSPVGFKVMNAVIEQLQTIEQTSTIERSSAFMEWHESVEDQVDDLAERILMSKSVVDMRDSVLTPIQDRYKSVETANPQPTIFNGISVLQNQPVPHAVFLTAKLCGQIQQYCPWELLRVIDAVDCSATAPGKRATFVTATLGVSPFSEQGISWLRNARAIVEDMSHGDSLRGVKVNIQGIASIEYDAMNAVYNAFPTMIFITALVVFTLMGSFFMSLLAPFRSILTLTLTLGFSFGLGVLVYQDGLLNWLQLRPLTSVSGGFCWLVPIMSFTIIVGLALDYDVFLTSRILEFRNDGFEHKTSIAAGLHSTGGIITAAGGILALAFGSLMLSSSPLLYQWSFLLTTAVLLDTFVVRTVVVPVVTGLAGSYCWWPRVFPESRFYMVCFQSQSNEDVRSLLRSLEETSEYEPIVRNPAVN
jgi:uncharacterized membrane protein YdfJ with MMPL/SSD domain